MRAIIVGFALAMPALAQPRGEPWLAPTIFQQTDGAALYAAACQSCHMPGGQGARGAGAYPALANNPRLEGAGYPLTLVVRGQGAMPGFATYLNDRQIAAVVGFIRTNFGNAHADPVAPEDAAALR